jgi:hypothetical protein
MMNNMRLLHENVQTNPFPSQNLTAVVILNVTLARAEAHRIRQEVSESEQESTTCRSLESILIRMRQLSVFAS